MSLLAKINERNQAVAQEQAQAEEQAAIESNRPSPDQQMQSDRQSMSQAFSKLPRQDMQEEPATPEEQQLYTQMEVEVVNLLNESRSGDMMLESILNSPDAVEAIAGVTADISSMLKQKYPQASQDVLFGVGQSTLEQVVQLVEAADPQIDLSQDEMAEAMSQALNQYMKSHPEEVDEDTQQYLSGPAPELNLGGYQ